MSCEHQAFQFSAPCQCRFWLSDFAFSSRSTLKKSLVTYKFASNLKLQRRYYVFSRYGWSLFSIHRMRKWRLNYYSSDWFTRFSVCIIYDGLKVIKTHLKAVSAFFFFFLFSQLLRTMFGINALCQPILVHNPVVPPCLAESNIAVPPPSERLPSLDEQLYHSCFVHPLSLIAQTLDRLKPKEESRDKAVEVLRFGTIICVLFWCALFEVLMVLSEFVSVE